jgi:hopanoid-associated phosphorylase
VSAFSDPARVIVVTGVSFEARIAAGGATIICGGGPQRLAHSLNEAIARGGRGIISFGIAGGLVAGLAPGEVIVANEVVTQNRRWPTDSAWRERLAQAIPGAQRLAIAGVDAPAAGSSEKSALHERTGAAAVDMESHVVADVAGAHGIPFVVLRTIADPLVRSLPDVARIPLRSGGSPNLPVILRGLAASPGQLPGLVQLAIDTWKARRALLRCRELLGPGFGFADAG